jgi:glycosyltransferase involved in cell wall biosynthesis
MKVLHINTFDKGGAFVAAERLSNGLIKKGISSRFVVLNKLTSNKAITGYFEEPRSFIHRVKESFTYRYYDRRKKKLTKHLNSSVSVSLPDAPYDITTHSLYKESDVIHLHWVSDFIDLPSFFRTNRKPVVWTLHDGNAFSGIFHYPIKQIPPPLITIDAKVRQQRAGMLNEAKNLSLVTPSKWLYTRLVEAMPLLTSRSYVIHNGLNEEISLSEQDRTETRRGLHISENDCVLAFVAEKISDPIKGVDLLLKALALMPDKGRVVLLVVGKIDEPIEGLKTICTGYVDKRNEYYRYLNAADIFIAPYLVDNFPNTLLEAMVTGLPLIGFKGGGIPEIIEDGVNGLLANVSDVNDLSNKINMLVNDSVQRRRLAKTSREMSKQFSIELQVDQYCQLYKQFLK